jgi:hypothetical protein
MAEFNIRADAVDVEQIMRQIRARIREKRGVDYTEDEIRRLASVKLEKFLEPSGVRSDLIEQFRLRRPDPPPPPGENYAFEEDTLFTSHRGIVRLVRRFLRPILKLFFNPGPLADVLHKQAELNRQLYSLYEWDRKRDALDPAYFEVMHNLVLEMTRLGIEVKNLKMQVESLSSRLDFDEHRARALEGVVQYKPGATVPPPAPRGDVRPDTRPDTRPDARPGAPAEATEGAGEERRRRRRRRRRHGGRPAEAQAAASEGLAPADDAPAATDETPSRADDDAFDGDADDKDAEDQ